MKSPKDEVKACADVPLNACQTWRRIPCSEAGSTWITESAGVLVGGTTDAVEGVREACVPPDVGVGVGKPHEERIHAASDKTLRRRENRLVII